MVSTTGGLLLFMASIFFVAAVQIKDIPGNCPDGTLEAPNHGCFNFNSDRKTFSAAEDSCVSMGGHLAVVDSLFTDAFLAENAANLNANDFWIGANVYTNLTSQPWVWTDANKLVVYTDWANGQPFRGETGGSNCAAISVTDASWSAVDCSLTKPYVCSLPRIIYNCPSRWTYFSATQACYRVFFDSNWQEAENTCLNNGAHLVSIHSQTENNFIMDIAQTGQSQGDYHGQTWIGLHTDENPGRSFRWSDGSPVDYTNWTPGSPDGSSSDRCVVFAVDSYTCWGCDKYQYHYTNDPCGEVLRNFVCKKPASASNMVYAS